jgi:hypothetical protein
VAYPAELAAWAGRKGHREIPQVEKAHLYFLSITKVLKNPLCRLFGKSTLPRAAQDY